jgi:hypothetical protein
MRCESGCVCGLILAIILAVCGTVMLAYYHRDDQHANAYGFIVGNQDCYSACGPNGVCFSSGTLNVLYHYLSTNISDTWYQGEVATPGFCGDNCCDGYVAGNVTVYFVVDDDHVKYASTVIDFNVHALLAFGVTILVLAAICVGVAWYVWWNAKSYQTLN